MSGIGPLRVKIIHWLNMVRIDCYSDCAERKTTEPTTGGILQKQMFFKISHNSQENTCARVSFFNKVAGLQLLRASFLQNTFGRLLLKPGLNLFFKETLWSHFWGIKKKWAKFRIKRANPIEHLWCSNFSEKTSLQMFNWILNTPLELALFMKMGFWKRGLTADFQKQSQK